MVSSLNHIARYTVVGFLLLAVSGLTIAIHHEHLIEGLFTENGHSQPNGLVVKTTPSTYNEVHFVKLLSGDSFHGSQKVEFKTFLVKIFAVHLDHLELSPAYHSSSLANINIKETGPPSVDKCVLFCSFLI